MENQAVAKRRAIGKRRRALASTAVTLGLLAGCSAIVAQEPTVPQENPNDPHIRVYFDASGCPRYVDNALYDGIAAGSGDKLRWRAYDISNGQRNTRVSYQVYFDPFLGRTNDSGNNGEVISKPLDGKIPANVLFKYTIMVDPLPAGCPPLDPLLRIR